MEKLVTFHQKYGKLQEQKIRENKGKKVNKIQKFNKNLKCNYQHFITEGLQYFYSTVLLYGLACKNYTN